MDSYSGTVYWTSSEHHTNDNHVVTQAPITSIRDGGG